MENPTNYFKSAVILFFFRVFAQIIKKGRRKRWKYPSAKNNQRLQADNWLVARWGKTVATARGKRTHKIPHSHDSVS